MTQVRIAQSPENPNVRMEVGQVWRGKDMIDYEIVSLEVLPGAHANNKNTRVTMKYHGGSETSHCTFLEFMDGVSHVIALSETPPEGLCEHHLIDPKLTIAVGQRWQHYKGGIYNITDVSLDSNVGEDDFTKARISYCSVDNGNNVNWNLSVDEFLKWVGGRPRFTPLPMTGKLKNNIRMDRSLKYYWRIAG